MPKPYGESFVSIVDDDPGICLALKALMRSAGLAAEAFLSAEDFLASGKLAETACLVLDMQLPKMSGLELQRHLAATGARVPIVFITAHDREEAQAEAIQLGAAAFLSKPLCRGVLLQGVLGIIDLPQLEGNLPSEPCASLSALQDFWPSAPIWRRNPTAPIRCISDPLGEPRRVICGGEDLDHRCVFSAMQCF